MKNFKLILVLAMVVATVACKKNNPDPDSDSDPVTDPTKITEENYFQCDLDGVTWAPTFVMITIYGQTLGITAFDTNNFQGPQLIIILGDYEEPGTYYMDQEATTITYKNQIQYFDQNADILQNTYSTPGADNDGAKIDIIINEEDHTVSGTFHGRVGDLSPDTDNTRYITGGFANVPLNP